MPKLLTYYCAWVMCAKHIDTHQPESLPIECPHCHREAWWTMDPPPFDSVLTEKDRAFLKAGHIGLHAPLVNPLTYEVDDS